MRRSWYGGLLATARVLFWNTKTKGENEYSIKLYVLARTEFFQAHVLTKKKKIGHNLVPTDKIFVKTNWKQKAMKDKDKKQEQH